MKGQRTARVGDRIREIVAQLLVKKVKDPRVSFCTITQVRMTSDLKIARIYFSVIEDFQDWHQTLKGLNSAKGYIRKELGRMVVLKSTPQIEFIHDDTFEEMDRVKHLLEKVKVKSL